jgi:hypothetical protein
MDSSVGSLTASGIACHNVEISFEGDRFVATCATCKGFTPLGYFLFQNAVARAAEHIATQMVCGRIITASIGLSPELQHAMFKM